MGCEKVGKTHQEMQDVAAGELLVPRFTEKEAEEDQQGSQDHNQTMTERLRRMMKRKKQRIRIYRRKKMRIESGKGVESGLRFLG